MSKKICISSLKCLRLVVLAVAAMGLASWAGRTDQSGCQGCARTAFVERATSDIPFYVERLETLLSSTQSRLVESLTTPCFYLVNRAVGEDLARKDWPESDRALSRYREAEYVFLVDFSRARPATKPGATRLTIELLYNGEPREKVFTLTTDSPIETYSSQVNRMYTNPDAVINQVKPIDEVLRDFERRPVSCEIRTAGGERVVPLGEVDVTITGFRDANGRPSREFNRIVVEAKRGLISGGESVLDDPKRQAFRIGDGTVKLKYQAPAECEPGQDEITVYSSCEILDPGKQPMERTRADRRIGSRQMRLVCAEGVLTFSYLYQSPKIYKEATIEIGLGRLDFSLPYGATSNNADYHPILYMKILKAKAFKDGLPGRGFRFLPMVEQSRHYLIITNPKSRKVVEVPVWNNLLLFKWSDGADGYMIQNCIKTPSKPTEGDGVMRASGACTHTTPDGTDSFKWTLKRIGRSGK